MKKRELKQRIADLELDNDALRENVEKRAGHTNPCGVMS